MAERRKEARRGGATRYSAGDYPAVMPKAIKYRAPICADSVDLLNLYATVLFWTAGWFLGGVR